MPSPVFRAEARNSDIESIRAITEGTGFFRPDEVDVAVELVQERLVKGESSGYHYWFAEVGGELAGYVCYGPTPCTIGSFDLYWIVVGSAFQGRGLGTRLMNRCELSAVKMGCGRMYVETSGKEQYQPTRRFYEKAGYFQAAVLSDFYDIGDAKIIFQKNL